MFDVVMFDVVVVVVVVVVGLIFGKTPLGTAAPLASKLSN
jgi:hypothetical protein